MSQDSSTVAMAPGQRTSLYGRVMDQLSAISVGIKVKLIILGLGLFPSLLSLLVLHQFGSAYLQNALALYVACFVLLYYPLSKLLEELIVLRQTRHINNYVDQVKSGKRAPRFDLPRERGDEHDFIRLQRNIFWMIQGLKTRENRLQETLSQLETAQRKVLESIEYASRIQRSFLPGTDELEAALGNYFLLWLPRDGVGGDAYWVRRSRNHTYLAVFDCTGHGVPGAFLTLIVNSLFEQHFDASCWNNPAQLLSKMNKGLKFALSQHDRQKLSDDGLEGGLCCIDREKQLLYFAGARSFLFLSGDEGIREIKGDKSGIGFVDVPLDQEFANRCIPLQDIHSAYLFTDGITDQIGGGKRLPFGRRRLRLWIEQHSGLPMQEQRAALETMFHEYKGRNAQRDDVTVLGFATKEPAC